MSGTKMLTVALLIGLILAHNFIMQKDIDTLTDRVNKLTEYAEVSIGYDKEEESFRKTIHEYNDRVLEYNKSVAPGALKQAQK